MAWLYKFGCFARANPVFGCIMPKKKYSFNCCSWWINYVLVTTIRLICQAFQPNLPQVRRDKFIQRVFLHLFCTCPVSGIQWAKSYKNYLKEKLFYKLVHNFLTEWHFNAKILSNVFEFLTSAGLKVFRVLCLVEEALKFFYPLDRGLISDVDRLSKSIAY